MREQVIGLNNIMFTYLPSRWNKGIDLIHIDLRTDEEKWDSINRQIKFILHANYMVDTIWYRDELYNN